MGGRLGWALGLLTASLILDVADGVAARRNGEDNPHVDWAADRFGELALIGGLFWRDSIWVGGAYSVCYALNIFFAALAGSYTSDSSGLGGVLGGSGFWRVRAARGVPCL